MSGYSIDQLEEPIPSPPRLLRDVTSGTIDGNEPSFSHASDKVERALARLQDAEDEEKEAGRRVAAAVNHIRDLVVYQGVNMTDQAYLDAYNTYAQAQDSYEAICSQDKVKKYKKRSNRNANNAIALAARDSASSTRATASSTNPYRTSASNDRSSRFSASSTRATASSTNPYRTSASNDRSSDRISASSTSASNNHYRATTSSDRTSSTRTSSTRTSSTRTSSTRTTASRTAACLPADNESDSEVEFIGSHTMSPNTRHHQKPPPNGWWTCMACAIGIQNSHHECDCTYCGARKGTSRETFLYHQKAALGSHRQPLSALQNSPPQPMSGSKRKSWQSRPASKKHVKAMRLSFGLKSNDSEDSEDEDEEDAKPAAKPSSK